MKPINRLNTLLEYIGQQGCDAARQAIERLEKGQCPAALPDLSREECKLLLGELRSIMAVYDRPGRTK